METENLIKQHPMMQTFFNEVRNGHLDETKKHYHALTQIEKAYLFLHAVRQHDLPILYYFVQEGFDINYEFSDAHNLYLPLDMNNRHCFLEIATINSKQGFNFDFCQEMITLGAKPSSADHIALFKAATEGNLNILQLYIQHGADPHAKNNGLLWSAASSGNFEMIKYLHEECHIPLREDGYDFLLACQIGNLDVVNYMVNHGANINAKNNYDNNALCSATAFEHLHIVSYLVDCGLNPQAVIDFEYNVHHYIHSLAHRSNPRGTCLEWAKNYIEKKKLHDNFQQNLLIKPELIKPKV